MQQHTFTLMSDGEVTSTRKPADLREAVATLKELAELMTRPGCHRLSISGPMLNGSLRSDVTSDAPTPRRVDFHPQRRIQGRPRR